MFVRVVADCQSADLLFSPSKMSRLRLIALPSHTHARTRAHLIDRQHLLSCKCCKCGECVQNKGRQRLLASRHSQSAVKRHVCLTSLRLYFSMCTQAVSTFHFLVSSPPRKHPSKMRTVRSSAHFSFPLRRTGKCHFSRSLWQRRPAEWAAFQIF